MNQQVLSPVAFVLCLAGSVACYLCRDDRVRSWCAVGVSIAVSAAFLLMAPTVLSGQVLAWDLKEGAGLHWLAFRVDMLSWFFGTLASGVWLLVSVYSLGYMKGGRKLPRYYGTLMLTMAGAVGAFMAAELVPFFLYFELMSIPAYYLVVHDGTDEANRAGTTYLFMTIAGGLALFFAIVGTRYIAGSLEIGTRYLIHTPSRLAFSVFLGFLLAFFTKGGIFPMHIWLARAHPVAPSPASALLSGIMIKMGAYGLIRTCYHMFSPDVLRLTGWFYLVLAAGVVSTLLGSFAALVQEDIKRRLAYSSIAQMGYVALGVGMLAPLGLRGAVFHVFAHAVMKSLLFLSAGAVIHETGKRRIAEWAGVGKTMPLTLSAFTVGALTMVGFPPLAGFLSKYYLGLGAAYEGMWEFVVLLILSSLLNAAYYLPIVNLAFFKRGEITGHDPGWSMLVPVLVLAVLCVAFTASGLNVPDSVARAVAGMRL
ncbi:MAG: proton-conducting transporter membrane subunit [Bacillota bacterium]